MSTQHIEQVESILMNQLDFLRTQKEEATLLEALAADFVDATCHTDTLLKSWISPALYDALHASSQATAETTLEDFISMPPTASLRLVLADQLNAIADGVSSLDLLCHSACKTIINKTIEFSRFIDSKLLVEEYDHNVLKKFARRPPPLYHMGLGNVEKLLFWILNFVVRPFVFSAYSELDWCQGYVVGYAAVGGGALKRSALVNHTGCK